MLHYIGFKKSESIDLIIISASLALMFSITTMRFDPQALFINTFILYFFYLSILLFSRVLFMKIIAYTHGFQIFFYQTHFSKYGPRKFDTLMRNSKGIPTSLLSLVLYLLTLGFLIFPSMWRFSTKKIPHLFVGTKQKYEYGMGFMIRRDVTKYREMKVMFWGFLYYGVFALLLHALFPELFFSWYGFMLFWIAFFTLIPIVGTEGWDFYILSRISYVAILTILILAMLCMFVFESTLLILLVTIFIGFLILFILFYKHIS